MNIQIDRSTLSRQVWQDPAYFVAFGFGSGLLPKIPGTYGTLASIPLYLILSHFSPTAYIVITLLAFVAGVFICDKVSRDLGVHDYSGIVWDEFVGYFLTMFLAPPGEIWMMIGFVLFRIVDIWKPYPISLIDKHVKGGFGIMIDDVIAALFAWVVMRLLIIGFIA